MGAIESIRRQTFTDWEIVLVDDGSVDESKDLYPELEKDNRIRIFRNEKNMGCGYTKRRCVEESVGTLCGFLDPDDELLPNALQVMVDTHLAHPEVSLVTSRYYFCDENLKPYRESRPLVIPKGRVVWKGYDTTGDFIFVNRWRWNFRRPARGEVMVFATTGIDRLVQGTHYIKRLTALPGETVEIVSPDVFIDGRKLDAPLKPMIGKRGEKTPEPNPGAAGGMTGPRTMGADEYFACGDNSDNSFDSRYWGPVPRENLKGVGSLVFWPIVNPRWGLIP